MAACTDVVQHKGQGAQSDTLGLPYIPPYLRGRVVQILTDNTAATFFNKQDGARSSALCREALRLWDFCVQQAGHLKASHLPGAQNARADLLSSYFSSRQEWSLHPKVVSTISPRYPGYLQSRHLVLGPYAISQQAHDEASLAEQCCKQHVHEPRLRADTVTLRSAKSEESLTSQSSTAGLHKLNRLRRPRSSSDAFPALPGALPGSPPAPLKPCRSCESLSSSASGGYSESLAPHRRTSLWLDDEGELDSDPELSPPGFLDLDLLPFRHSPPWRPSLSEASDSAPSPARLPFACKVTRALSPRGPEPPTAALEISEPVAISLPAKVLEMLGGGETGGVLRPGRRWGTRSPPHMISRLLQAGDGMLTDSCQREVQHKLTQAESGSLAQ
ncbi:rho GTPase-activating protein 33-like, partial [Terrapene carolina triunguis]|uniref:rho GTPase-activating protein 33-like n=1 Tax=Terrapene triunguis TaxID=2587831 RepID=UPI0011562C8F